jgi:serine/threonine protein kinase
MLIFRSLGCTIIEMLTTKPPYSEMIYARFISALVHQSLSYDVKNFVSASTSGPMIMFLTNLLQLDPAKRLKTGKEAADKFRELFSVCCDIRGRNF